MNSELILIEKYQVNKCPARSGSMRLTKTNWESIQRGQLFQQKLLK
jgi:hypothetical protein